jgi:hypothetical protein
MLPLIKAIEGMSIKYCNGYSSLVRNNSNFCFDLYNEEGPGFIFDFMFALRDGVVYEKFKCPLQFYMIMYFYKNSISFLFFFSWV